MAQPHLGSMLGALALVDQRSAEIVEPGVLALVEAMVRHVLNDGPRPVTVDERDRDVAATIEQMLVDVSALDDEAVRRAAAHFVDGTFADVVTASYAIEARVRLELMSAALWTDR